MERSVCGCFSLFFGFMIWTVAPRYRVKYNKSEDTKNLTLILFSSTPTLLSVPFEILDTDTNVFCSDPKRVPARRWDCKGGAGRARALVVKDDRFDAQHIFGVRLFRAFLTKQTQSQDQATPYWQSSWKLARKRNVYSRPKIRFIRRV